MSFGGGLPVSAGVSLVLMTNSRGRRLGPMPCSHGASEVWPIAGHSMGMSSCVRATVTSCNPL